MKYKLRMMKFWSDWTDINELEIETSDYEKFKIIHRSKTYSVLYGFKNNNWIDINEKLNHIRRRLPIPMSIKQGFE